jgi:transposase-like protein
MTCPRCGGGGVEANKFRKPDGTVWMIRYVCKDWDCKHTWSEQLTDPPTEEDRERARRNRGGP